MQTRLAITHSLHEAVRSVDLVAGLSISSLPKYITLWPRAKRAGTERAWWRTVALSMLNSLAAGCGALLLGIVAREVSWGRVPEGTWH